MSTDKTDTIRWLHIPNWLHLPNWLHIPNPPRPAWAVQVDRMITAAEEGAAWIAGLPRNLQRRLAISTVRCPGGEVLLRLYRLPDTSPFVRAAGRHYLAVPTSRATYPSSGRAAPMWVMSMRDSWRLSCRCHRAEITVTAADLPGGTNLTNVIIIL